MKLIRLIGAMIAAIALSAPIAYAQNPDDVSTLQPVITMHATDVVPCVQPTVPEAGGLSTHKCTAAQIATYVGTAGGAVTNVTGTAPISSSGGATPNITVAAGTNSAKGVVEADGTTINSTAGILNCITATTLHLGCLEPDGTTITVVAGVISANQNITGNAAGLSGTPALPNNTTATTQSVGDTSTDVATNAFVANSYAAPPTTGYGHTTPEPVAATNLSFTGTLTGAVPIANIATALTTVGAIAGITAAPTAASSSQPGIGITGTNCTSVGTQKGGNLAGSLIVTTSGSCSAAITLTFAVSAPNEYRCLGGDETHSAGFIQTGGSATTAILSGTASTSGDKVSWICVAY